MSEDVRVFRSLSASKPLIDAAATRKLDVLAQLYEDAVKGVSDDVREMKLTPLSDVLVFISVEQWCEKKP